MGIEPPFNMTHSVCHTNTPCQFFHHNKNCFSNGNAAESSQIHGNSPQRAFVRAACQTPPHGSLFFSKHQDDGCKAKPAGKQPLGCHIVPKPVGSRNLLPGGTRRFLVTPGFNLDLCRKRLLESETCDAFVFLSFKLHKEKKQKQTD